MDGILYKGYDSKRMVLSSLGNPSSPVRTVYNIWMLMAGILFLLSIPVIYTYYHNISPFLSVLCAVFVGIFAIGACVFTCFFSVNESKEIVNTASKIHGVGSVLGFMVFLFVPLILAICEYKLQNKLIGSFNVIAFIISFLSFILFVMADKPEFRNIITEV